MYSIDLILLDHDHTYISSQYLSKNHHQNVNYNYLHPLTLLQTNYHLMEEFQDLHLDYNSFFINQTTLHENQKQKQNHSLGF
jgi:hypothetical protein